MEIAEPIVKRKSWPFALVWIIPLLVAVVAGLYFRDYLENKGPEVVIDFPDASGLHPGESRVMHKGAEIGRVTGVELSENHHHALVHIELQKREDVFASKGAVFWIVRPEISERGLSGLGTLFSGPYIDAVPGKGEEEITEIEGLSHAPKPYEEGEHFILTVSKLGHIQEGSSVYYKGIGVGSVQEIELSPEADHLNVHILVLSRYAALVRDNSKFWIDSGFDFKAGLFSGVKIKLDSMRTLISGGIAFATPEKDIGPAAKSGHHFAIEEDAKKEWEQWSPHISISPRAGDAAKAATALPAAEKRIRHQ